MTKDPVCGMKLSEEKAPARYEYKGTTYYFCGEGCKERFEHDPEKYLSGKPVDWIVTGRSRGIGGRSPPYKTVRGNYRLPRGFLI